MEPLKHECGVAMVRLRKPLSFYKEKYGTYAYGLNLLYLLMEKQHNRGQEGAGIGAVKINSEPGHEYIFRERAEGPNSITEIFSKVMPAASSDEVENMTFQDAERYAPFIGEVYVGHLRYSTTGKRGINYVHPFLRRNNWKSRNLMICGNFNLTNVDEIFRDIIKVGQHPRIYSDTVLLLEQLGYALDKECHRIYRDHRHLTDESEIEEKIEQTINVCNVLRHASPQWDGGYVVCGIIGSGDMFALRDPHGIRPAYYYIDDEVVIVASERPAIQTVINAPFSDIRELMPGEAIMVGRSGRVALERVLNESDNRRCSFERIYFSRGNDREIYKERKQLGYRLVPQILEAIDHDLDHTIFSFIPNTAEVAFIGMINGLEQHLDEKKKDSIISLHSKGLLDNDNLERILSTKLRIEKLALKDIKLRTFITEGHARNEMAAHVYDITYGCVKNGEDTIAVIDDSIVRGTTLRQSIIKILDRLHPKKIVVISSCPQVRYPDYYGIDMSSMGEFIAFRAAIELLIERNQTSIIDQTYRKCLEELEKPDIQQINAVKAIYHPFDEKEISKKIGEMLTPSGIDAEVTIVYQTLDNLRDILRSTPGDWYFSGEYPTPGGNRLVNKAFIDYYTKTFPNKISK